VSNSSSSSFIIHKEGLSEEQMNFIEFLGTPEFYRDNEDVIEIDCKDKCDHYRLEVDSCNGGEDGNICIRQELNYKYIKYEIQW